MSIPLVFNPVAFSLESVSNSDLKNSSPLEWAFAARQIQIARLLLQKGADVHHISSRGWTATFNLFNSTNIINRSVTSENHPVTEFLELLTANSFSEFDAQDLSGWSCIHRSAGYGDGNDIIHFSNIKAPLMNMTRDLLWTPIFCAVHLDNEATFKELRNIQKDYLIVTDVRDWALLHVAVYAGSFKVMRELLRLGADPLLETKPALESVPKELGGLSLTPGDIARYRGKETLKAYAECVQEYHPEIDFRIDVEIGDEGQGDIFWPAKDT